MTREELATASDHLESAAAATDNTAAGERLSELAKQLANLAESETEADHGRIARIQAAINEVKADVSDDVAATMSDARDELSAYRETIDGV
ncbi:DUF7553 family protein [Halovenus halobia]|uniref:DUF7553 family protein n=1 Tax=Halovenus halobia TaxID=3396622 RepID=UPI003F55DB58